MTTLLVTATLGLLCLIAGLGIYVMWAARRDEIEGQRMAKLLASYHYPTGTWRKPEEDRPDSWHPDRTGDNKP